MKKLVQSFLEAAQNPLIAIVGPTASGKTSLSVELAHEFGAEVVSADSRQIYRYMNIGTAKATPEEQAEVPHFMIDIVDPDQPFTVVDFQEQASKCIRDIHTRERIPLLVGGTGLYISSIVDQLKVPQVAPKPELRAEYEQIIAEKGSNYLHMRLKEKDALAAEKIHPNNTHHIIRALEVVETLGKSKFHLASKRDVPWDVLLLGIEMDREVLYERIDRRVLQMFEQGLIDETKQLLSMGYKPDLPAMSSIGYQDIEKMLAGELEQPEVIQNIQKKSRNYAKRQMTWFRRMQNIHWLGHEVLTPA